MIGTVVWLLANWVLDLIMLVGLLGMTLPDYATQIGLRYLVIPAMVIAARVVTKEVMKRKAEKFPDCFLIHIADCNFNKNIWIKIF